MRRASYSPTRKASPVDPDFARTLIRQKLEDGRLPHNSVPRIWGGPANGEICDGCDQAVEKGTFVMEGVSWTRPSARFSSM